MSAHDGDPAAVLTVRQERHGGVVVVSLVGELDMATADDAADRLDLAAASASTLVVDLTGVRFFGSAGLNVLLRLRAAGVDVRLVADHQAVLRPLQLMGVADQFVIHRSVDDAVESVRP
ncbi:MAG TPA: STAS domain-containing protein [Pseudonocardiaceae bacterium]|jgi:anti-anti-sigma factor|nr:STAS domain-containing protein [Pseudonocardiaceae bacterium]